VTHPHPLTSPHSVTSRGATDRRRRQPGRQGHGAGPVHLQAGEARVYAGGGGVVIGRNALPPPSPLPLPRLQIAERHGAHIGVESVPGHGACFFVEVPFRCLRAARPPSAAAGGGPLRTGRPATAAAGAGAGGRAPTAGMSGRWDVEPGSISLGDTPDVWSRRLPMPSPQGSPIAESSPQPSAVSPSAAAGAVRGIASVNRTGAAVRLVAQPAAGESGWRLGGGGGGGRRGGAHCSTTDRCAQACRRLAAPPPQLGCPALSTLPAAVAVAVAAAVAALSPMRTAHQRPRH
jgi:hypothetical protein